MGSTVIALDRSALTTRETNRAIKAALAAGQAVRVRNPGANHNIGVALLQPGSVTVEGSVGYYCGAMNDGATIEINGSAGWGLAEGMLSGLVTVQGAGMSGVPSFAARVFDTCAIENVSVLMISQSSSQNSICLVVPEDASLRLRGALERIFSAELRRHDVERVSVEAPVAIVAAVGEGMRGAPGVAGRVLGALGRAGVNVMAIAQGSSVLNISLVVAERDRDRAVLAVHGEFHSESDLPA